MFLLQDRFAIDHLLVVNHLSTTVFVNVRDHDSLAPFVSDPPRSASLHCTLLGLSLCLRLTLTCLRSSYLLLCTSSGYTTTRYTCTLAAKAHCPLTLPSHDHVRPTLKKSVINLLGHSRLKYCSCHIRKNVQYTNLGSFIRLFSTKKLRIWNCGFFGYNNTFPCHCRKAALFSDMYKILPIFC